MTVIVSSNSREVGVDLGRIGYEATRRIQHTVEEAAVDVRDEWRANATVTAGEHGKHYPKAIRYDMLGPTEAAIYPDPSKPQGDMSFEHGSVNQPPHLDGQIALDTMAPRIRRRIEAALTF